MRRHSHPQQKRTRCPGGGKLRFRDHRGAVAYLQFAENARSRAERDGVTTGHREVRPYECPVCHGWHTTSQPAELVLTAA